MPLYIAKSGDLDRCYRCLTDWLTHWQTLKDIATQLITKYKSGSRNANTEQLNQICKKNNTGSKTKYFEKNRNAMHRWRLWKIFLLRIFCASTDVVDKIWVTGGYMLRNMQFWNPKFECNFLSFEYTKWECISFRGELVTTRMSSQQNVQFVDLPFLNVSMCRKFWVNFLCRKMSICVFVCVGRWV